MTPSPHQLEVSEALGIAHDDFGEQITLHGDEDQAVNVMVRLDEAARDSEGDEPAVYTGQLRLPVSEKTKLQLDSNPVLTATIRGETWHIVDVGTESFGFLPIGIRRDAHANKHSNIFDLKDEQAP
jgi:hypothetical protein